MIQSEEFCFAQLVVGNIASFGNQPKHGTMIVQDRL